MLSFIYETNVFFIHLCFRIFFLIDTHCKRQNYIFSDLLKITRIFSGESKMFWSFLATKFKSLYEKNDHNLIQLWCEFLFNILIIFFDVCMGSKLTEANHNEPPQYSDAKYIKRHSNETQNWDRNFQICYRNIGQVLKISVNAVSLLKYYSQTFN